MKKAFLLASVLFISVISTACINNFAVQELNNKAKTFMEKGDYVSAIERLKSSIDLDGSIFETHYNLAVAYTNAEDYLNAVKSYKDAIKLNPDFADAYYSLAVCEENLAKDIISGELLVNEDWSIIKVQDDKKSELDKNAKEVLISYLNDSVADYEIYLDKAQEPEDVQDELNELKNLIEKYSVK